MSAVRSYSEIEQMFKLFQSMQTTYLRFFINFHLDRFFTYKNTLISFLNPDWAFDFCLIQRLAGVVAFVAKSPYFDKKRQDQWITPVFTYFVWQDKNLLSKHCKFQNILLRWSNFKTLLRHSQMTASSVESKSI